MKQLPHLCVVFALHLNQIILNLKQINLENKDTRRIIYPFRSQEVKAMRNGLIHSSLLDTIYYLKLVLFTY